MLKQLFLKALTALPQMKLFQLMQMVFSSQAARAFSGSSVGFSNEIGTVRISICQSWQNFSQTT